MASVARRPPPEAIRAAIIDVCPFEHFGDAGQCQAGPQRRHRTDDTRQPHYRNDRGIPPEFCRNELFHPLEEVRHS